MNNVEETNAISIDRVGMIATFPTSLNAGGSNAPASSTRIAALANLREHLTLATNLLNAVGGQPRLDIPEMLPGFSRYLPTG
jgi:Ferritin-like